MHQHKHHYHFERLGWVICILAAFFYCYEYLLRIEPSVMVTDLMTTFKITATSLGVLSAMYYYAYTPLQAIVGMIIDYFGPRRVLLLAIALCALGSWVFGISNNLYLAGLGRFLIGAGSAFAFVGALKLAAIWLPHERFALFVGMTTGLGMVGAMIGDVSMSAAVYHLGWHSVILWGIYIGVVLFILFFFFVREHHPKDQPHPAAMYLPFKELMISFAQITKDKQLWFAGLLGCMLYLSLSAFAEMWGIAFVHSAGHVPNYFAAKLNSAVFLGWLIGSPFSGWISNKIKSRRKPLLVGSLLAAFMMTLILMMPQAHPIILAIFLFLFGLFSSSEILVFVVARESVKLKVTATAVSFVNFVIMLGGMIFQPLIGWLLDWHWTGQSSHGVRVYSVLDFKLALLVIPVLMLMSALLAYFLKETYRPSHRI